MKGSDLERTFPNKREKNDGLILREEGRCRRVRSKRPPCRPQLDVSRREAPHLEGHWPSIQSPSSGLFVCARMTDLASSWGA